MRGREAIEFLVKVVQIDVRHLVRVGLPRNVADLSHIAGVCYELVRFSQYARSFYDQLVRAVTQKPETLEARLRQLRDLIEAVADGEDFEMSLESPKGAEAATIRIEGSHFRRQDFHTPLPFTIWAPTFRQGLVVTATYYLALTRDTHLIRRCRLDECRKLFVAVRKSRVYCSHECASKASMRAYEERRKKEGRQ